MQIKEYQNQVHQWITTIGKNYFDPMTNTTLLMEEVGEFARIMARLYGQQSFKNPEDEANAQQQLQDEICDMLFVITCLANQTGVDLESSILANFQKKSLRDKERHQNNPKIQGNPE